MKNYPQGRKRGRSSELLGGTSSLTAEQKLKQRDLELMNSRQLRAARLKRLEEMGQEGQAEAEGKELVWRVPDGVALENGKDEDGRGMLLADEPAQPDGGAQLLLRSADGQPTVRSGACVLPADHVSPADATLNNPISCYTCKKTFRELHSFYDQLCPACAELNYAKRRQVACLDGKLCIVTGARVKIGYRCALKLLRCGATVLATSRFPQDTVIANIACTW